MADEENKQYGENPFTPTGFAGSEFIDFTKPGDLTTEERIVRIEDAFRAMQTKDAKVNSLLADDEYGAKYGKNITWINDRLGEAHNNLAADNQTYAPTYGQELCRFGIPGDTLVAGDGVGPSMYHLHLDVDLAISVGTIVFFYLFADEAVNLLPGLEQIMCTAGGTAYVGTIDIYLTRASQKFTGTTDPNTYIEFNARFWQSANLTMTTYLARDTKNLVTSTNLDTRRKHTLQLLATCSPANTANMVVGSGYCERLY